MLAKHLEHRIAVGGLSESEQVFVKPVIDYLARQGGITAPVVLNEPVISVFTDDVEEVCACAHINVVELYGPACIGDGLMVKPLVRYVVV